MTIKWCKCGHSAMAHGTTEKGKCHGFKYEKRFEACKCQKFKLDKPKPLGVKK